jgi:signal transduction histidine kinase
VRATAQAFLSAPWPSGKAADCKSATRRFDSDRRLSCSATNPAVSPVFDDTGLRFHNFHTSDTVVRRADVFHVVQYMSSSSSTLRLRWPLIVLLASIALTALAAFDAQRTVRAQNNVVTRATHEFASFTAWSFGQHLQERLSNSAKEVLGAVNHGDHLHTGANIPPAEDLVHYLPWDERCMCHRPRQGPIPADFVAVRLGSERLDVAANSFPDPTQGWTTEPVADPMMMDAHPSVPLAPAERRWIVDTLTRQVRAHPLADRGFALVVSRSGTSARVLSYTVMPMTSGDTIVYAARYTREQLAITLASVLDGPGLLPSTFTQGRRNRDVVAVRVRDESGNLIFDSAPGSSSPVSSRLALPRQYGALELEALVRPEQAGTLVIGGLPRSRLPFLLGLLALAAAMSLVAVAQIRRETELASLRGDFVSSVSHELRTPLAQIRLYLETIRLGRASTPEQRDWSLGHIERETTRLSYLVENVLRFSRLGRPDPPPAALVDVSAEARRIVEEFQPLAAARNATVESEIGNTPKVLLRPEAVRHMLINLLDNAVKYGPAGQTIHVRVRQDQGELRLSVSDEGPGVVEQDREMIWRPFSRGRSARGAAGSGIGLSIVRDVAAQNGGRAWVEGSPGGGACFIVTIQTIPGDSPSVHPPRSDSADIPSPDSPVEREPATIGG